MSYQAKAAKTTQLGEIQLNRELTTNTEQLQLYKGTLGTWIKLSEQTMNNVASVTFKDVINDTYRLYAFTFHDCEPSGVFSNASVSTTMYAQFSQDNGSTFTTANYVTQAMSSAADGGSVAAGIGVLGSQSSGPDVSAGVLYWYRSPSPASQPTQDLFNCYGVFTKVSNVWPLANKCDCGVNQTTTLKTNAVKFYWGTGNAVKGVVRLYGIIGA
ncbi:MAG: hypothetical protein K0S07_929 [Chlamydiales bacterium]|jgi:hypothetical protein|nr:hypothetical protein [Chlamydiales bacterium]